jgi:hypothetical protein
MNRLSTGPQGSHGSISVNVQSHKSVGRQREYCFGAIALVSALLDFARFANFAARTRYDMV